MPRLARIIFIVLAIAGIVYAGYVLVWPRIPKNWYQALLQRPIKDPNLVVINNKALNVPLVIIHRGDQITWHNDDTVNHHLVGNKGEFDTGVLKPQETFTATFNTIGEILYHSVDYPNIIGRIDVQK